MPALPPQTMPRFIGERPVDVRICSSTATAIKRRVSGAAVDEMPALVPAARLARRPAFTPRGHAPFSPVAVALATVAEPACLQKATRRRCGRRACGPKWLFLARPPAWMIDNLPNPPAWVCQSRPLSVQAQTWRCCGCPAGTSRPGLCGRASHPTAQERQNTP